MCISLCLFNLCSFSASIIKSKLDLKNKFLKINKAKNHTIGPSQQIKQEFYSFSFMLSTVFAVAVF